MSIPHPDFLVSRQPDSLAGTFATSYAGVIAFIAVATEGNFAKAGDRLGIGRSAVSRAVQKLEDQLGTRLFVRTTRHTTLTVEGQRFLDQCQPGVERIIRALDDMRELRDGPPTGQLRVCSTVGFGRKIVAPLIHGFRASYPAISVELRLDDGPTDFTTDRVDLSFRNGRMEDSQVIAKKIIPMQMMLCASPGYAARHGVPASVDALAGHHGVNFMFASGRVYEWEFKIGAICASSRRRPCSRSTTPTWCCKPCSTGTASPRWPAIRSATTCGRAAWSPSCRSMRPTIAATTCASWAASIFRPACGCSLTT